MLQLVWCLSPMHLLYQPQLQLPSTCTALHCPAPSTYLQVPLHELLCGWASNITMQYLIINNGLVVQSAGGDATTGKQVGGDGIAIIVIPASLPVPPSFLRSQPTADRQPPQNRHTESVCIPPQALAAKTRAPARLLAACHWLVK